MSYKSVSLPKQLLRIIQHKETEAPFSGAYDEWDKPGTYLCRQCGLALFRARSKFHSGCGWPSFDDEIKNAVKREPDPDGHRTEIVCMRCAAHLGHVFTGEKLTAKDLRHCVNSLSLDFIENQEVLDTEEAIFAAGCFWGVEYFFKRHPGVLKTEVGYTGGNVEYPQYEAVCHQATGHFEAIRVIYDPKQVSYENLAKFFFEIHDPSQIDGQGPDIGEQYLSVAFYYDKAQQDVIRSLIQKLTKKGLSIATKVLPVSPFWPAESYHQDYYEKNHKIPYCHHYEKRF